MRITVGMIVSVIYVADRRQPIEFKLRLLASGGESIFTLRLPWVVAKGKWALLISPRSLLGAMWLGALDITSMEGRASYCSLTLRSNFGQSSARGVGGVSLLRNWRPIQTPRAKASLRVLKKLSNRCVVFSYRRTDLTNPAPAPNTSP